MSKKRNRNGEKIILKTKNKHVKNFCGKADLNLSAKIIEKCSLLLTNDTGMMHIGAALKKIISFWGCTKPSQGFSPYLDFPVSVEVLFTVNTQGLVPSMASFVGVQWMVVKKIKPEVIINEIKSFKNLLILIKNPST